MSRRPVLVTGAAGFAGSHLVERLAPHADVVAWIRSSRPDNLPRGTVSRQIDLLDRDAVRSAIRDLDPEVVYHCAGAAHVAHSWQNAAHALAANVLATDHLLDALRRTGSRSRVLIPGSAHVYAPADTPLSEDSPLGPASPYAFSKLAQEQLGVRAVAEDGIDVIVTRSFNHTGPRQSPEYFASGVARQIALIEKGRTQPVIQVGYLDSQRDLTDVRDTVRAYELLIEKGTPGSVYNIASGVARPVRAVLEGLVRRSRVTVRVEVDPARLRPHDIPVLVGDATRLREATGWSPEIPFERTLDDLLQYWRSRPDL